MRICFLISPSFSTASLTGRAPDDVAAGRLERPDLDNIAWTSRVSVLVMDCTVIGRAADARLPTLICRVCRRVIIEPSYLKILVVDRTRSL
jgi:hypothetical protein